MDNVWLISIIVEEEDFENVDELLTHYQDYPRVPGVCNTCFTPDIVDCDAKDVECNYCDGSVTSCLILGGLL